MREPVGRYDRPKRCWEWLRNLSDGWWLLAIVLAALLGSKLLVPVLLSASSQHKSYNSRWVTCVWGKSGCQDQIEQLSTEGWEIKAYGDGILWLQRER